MLKSVRSFQFWKAAHCDTTVPLNLVAYVGDAPPRSFRGGYEDLVIADMRELWEKFGKFDHDSTRCDAGDQLSDQAGLP